MNIPGNAGKLVQSLVGDGYMTDGSTLFNKIILQKMQGSVANKIEVVFDQVTGAIELVLLSQSVSVGPADLDRYDISEVGAVLRLLSEKPLPPAK